MKYMRIWFISILAVLLLLPAMAIAQADAGPDTVTCKTGTVVIGKNTNNDWCYSWSPIHGLDNPTAPKPTADPDSTLTYTLTVTGENFSFKSTDEVKVIVMDSLYFLEDNSQDYGFDDWTNKGGTKFPWKSVEKGEDDPVKAKVVPPNGFEGVYFKSSVVAKATVSPAQMGANNQTVTITGVAKGADADIEGNCGSASGDNLHKCEVAVYEKQSKTIMIRLVHEDNDDIQVIPVGNGKPNQVCINNGTDTILNSTASGDDQVVGKTITTGADGVCNSTASGNDAQVIPVNQGQPNQLCVRSGPNNFRDTHPKSGDDVITGDSIYTGADGICNTAANNTDIISSNYSDAVILAALNDDIFNQAVHDFTITRLPAKTINFDLDRDGMYDDDGAFMSTAEAQLIRDSCKDDTYDANFFLIDNPKFGNTALGQMGFNQRYAFINVANHSAPNTVEQTGAHEAGHGLFGLRHPGPGTSGCGASDGASNYQDPDNLMDYCSKIKLRKFQWDLINP
ncbi:MAG: hypothetical protein WD077_02200 [Bacteroidia bacterium]